MELLVRPISFYCSFLSNMGIQVFQELELRSGHKLVNAVQNRSGQQHFCKLIEIVFDIFIHRVLT